MSFQVYRDGWGIPHLRADSPYELAYAQGHTTALDRAWQIEVERHRAQGSTAAFLGAQAVGWDRFARRARLADTARRCLGALDADTNAWLAAYADGVTAGLAEGARRSPEFGRVGLAPGRWRPWTPLAVWLSAHILFTGFPTKLWRDEVARHLGEEAAGLFAADGPGTPGSNGWLVPGDRTATGAPLLAGDPHRFIEAPGVYQQIRLACPEYDAVGLAVPGVPGLPHFGHTGRVAWAVTNAMADCQDLYRERLRRRGTGVQALGPDGWRPAAAHVETIEVAGAAPVAVEVVETDRGPLVAGDPDSGTGLSLRHPPRAYADLGFAALPALLRARTVADVDRALESWIEPVNVVQAADADGGLLHRVAGRVPLRSRRARLRPVPAWEPGHAWRGWHDPLPRAEVDGVAVMANARGTAGPLGVEFAPPHRERRIRRLLAESATWSGKGMAAIHTDTCLPSAAALLDLVAGLPEGPGLSADPGLSAEARRLRERLLGWDRRMDADSREATAYAAVRSAVVRRVASLPSLTGLADLPSSADPAAGSGYPDVFAPWLALVPRVAFALEPLLTTRHVPGLDRPETVRAALEEVAAVHRSLPPWGEVHRLAPWQALPAEEAPDWPGVAGDHDCVLSAMSVPGVTDRCPRGPAARYVWDLARREDSLWVVPLGASGVPGDAHYRDQLALWLRGELIPVVTDWDELTEETP
ncbi:penicillin acylase family protein [Streptomyces sp. B1866]|uniref:penicillin acylase family protein n=1 Tax=Streptomyces sp. B1866 TaxID=3075431 RepID=UPI00288DD0A9|nr:penicillin acylase family protein [Streptomyces sp. B1866]MDT3399245.1 penicillin acylase family protein [Streptomyces sp. B1866]